MKTGYKILAIDTSCDETAAAVTFNDRVLSNVVSSQIQVHKKYGGVVPMLAKRMHQEYLDPVIKEAITRSFKGFHLSRGFTPDAIAVTVGPGLAPALEVGIAKAKELARNFHKPLIAINHMEAHLLSSFAKNSKGTGSFSKTPPQFPIIGLLVSGGHTQLVLMNGFGRYQLLGETLDDAAGEAFDKVAKMLDLGYPGGPIISELAKKGKPKYRLPIPMERSKDLNFSFSGLKTACFYRLRELKPKANPPASWRVKQFYYDFSASFTLTIAKALAIKLKKAILLHHPKQIVLGGGVINNFTVRKEVRRVAHLFGLSVFIPYTTKLFTDNAAMVGVCAWYHAQQGNFVKNFHLLDRQPNLNFPS